MSAIAGILDFQGREVHHELLYVLDRALSHLGPDGGSILSCSQIGFVHRAFHTTPESRSERQPCESGGVIAACDGRLDNGPELSRMLGLRYAERNDIETILMSYLKWGTDCFRRFQGDFSIAIWDPRDKLLLLARDRFAVRRLFYTASEQFFMWATTPDALLRVPGTRLQIDEEYIASYLVFCPHLSHSAFSSVKPVLPGTFITVKDGSCITQSFWNFNDIGLARATPEKTASGEYAEQFRELFAEAVRVRLRADGPVIAELSGGLDSSSIVCMADAISNASSGHIPRVKTLSHVYNGAKEADERDFISEIERQRGEQGIHLKEEDDPILSNWPDPEFISSPCVAFCSGSYFRGSLKAQDLTGGRIFLSGLFGDELLRLRYIPFDTAHLIRKGRLIGGLSLCFRHSLKLQRPLLGLFWQFGIRPNLPVCMRVPSLQIPSWVDARLIRRTDICSQIKRAYEFRPDQLKKGIYRFPDLRPALALFSAERTQRPTSFGCWELRYPFLHAPLVEFLLSLPTEQLVRPDSTRWIQRIALKGTLPERVRLRTSKGMINAAVINSVNREWDKIESLLRRCYSGDLGYVNVTRVREEFELLRRGVFSGSNLFKFISLEMWLRALSNRRQSWTTPPRGFVPPRIVAGSDRVSAPVIQ